MSARDKLRQVFAVCIADARGTDGPLREVAAMNAAMLAGVILCGTDADCQARVDKLMRAAPELFPS